MLQDPLCLCAWKTEKRHWKLEEAYFRVSVQDTGR